MLPLREGLRINHRDINEQRVAHKPKHTMYVLVDEVKGNDVKMEIKRERNIDGHGRCLQRERTLRG